MNTTNTPPTRGRLFLTKLKIGAGLLLVAGAVGFGAGQILAPAAVARDSTSSEVARSPAPEETPDADAEKKTEAARTVAEKILGSWNSL
jgi:hypothetical protein